MHIFELMFWYGIAAMGFAVLFNVPKRTLPVIFFIGAAAGFTKLALLKMGANVIVASLCGSMVIGFISIPFAHLKHSPPLVFSIPSVIPLVPGIFAFRMVTGLIKLAGDIDQATYLETLSTTINSGLKVIFILLSIAGGVAVPMLLTRQQSVKHVRLKKRKVSNISIPGNN